MWSAGEDQTIGIRILSCPIEEPMRQIVEHAGEDAANAPEDEEQARPTGGGMGEMDM